MKVGARHTSTSSVTEPCPCLKNKINLKNKTDMKKIIYLSLAAALLCVSSVAQAQTKSSYLKVTHTTSGTAATDDIAFDGGEISILNDKIDVKFASDASRNRSYAFDKVISLAFESRNPIGISDVEEIALSVFIDESGVLHIQSEQAIGEVAVYSVTGALIAQTTSQANAVEINLSAQPQGVYVVQTTTATAKIIKQ
jgi:hypothetical protein